MNRSMNAPLDIKALDLLALCSQEAFEVVRQAEEAARVGDAASAYEELKRRRAQQQ
jgi:hypothetical protein